VPIVKTDPGIRQAIVMATVFFAACIVVFSVIGTRDYNWTSQPAVRYPATAVAAGVVAVGALGLVWLARSQGGALVWGVEGGLIVLPPIWPLRRTFIPVSPSERNLVSVAVVETRSGVELGSSPRSSKPWTLVVKTPSEVLHVNVRGIEVQLGYREKLDLWRRTGLDNSGRE
jgi:hypothetical protein